MGFSLKDTGDSMPFSFSLDARFRNVVQDEQTSSAELIWDGQTDGQANARTYRPFEKDVRTLLKPDSFLRCSEVIRSKDMIIAKLKAEIQRRQQIFNQDLSTQGQFRSF